MSIIENLKNIQERIASAALRTGRNPHEVRLVAVSKTQSSRAVSDAVHAGQFIFGENYVQELTSKATEVTSPVDWHFIGSLQSNKVKYLVDLVTTIHSVDKLTLAQEISKQWGRAGKCCDILLEVNIAEENTKGGTTIDNLLELTRDVARLPHLKIKGLMTMPPFFDDPDAARPYFRELRRLATVLAEAKIPGVEMTELSMGMSGDFEIAIEEGATLVRVGTALFGERTYAGR